jgi:hypothetical protein
MDSWETRNEKIVDNIISILKNKKPKTMLVTFGLHHKYILDELLLNKYNVKSKPIPAMDISTNDSLSESVLHRWQKNNNLLIDNLESDTLSNELKAFY